MSPDFQIDYQVRTRRHSSCHFHPYYEICFFESGSRTYTVGEKYYGICSNTAILIPPYVQHSTKGSSDSARTVFYFEKSFLEKYFSPALTESLLSCFQDPVKALPPAEAEAKETVEKIRRAFAEGNEERCALFLAQLLAYLKTKKTEGTEEPSSPITAPVIAYLYENAHWIGKIESVAEHFHISVSYLSSVFKSDVGIPIKRYLIRLRINLACRALVLSDQSVSRIGSSCGFASSSHFCNTFKKEMHQTPKEYRDTYRKNKA